MSERREELNLEIEGAQGNLWKWNNTNPYASHPLRVLGLAEKERAQPAMINSAVKKLQSKARFDEESENASDLIAMPPGQAAELLRNPVTRVIAEFMRVPPVLIAKDELKQLPVLGSGKRKSKLELPLPELIAYDENIIIEVFRNYLLDEVESGLSELPKVDYGQDPTLLREPHAGITFWPRKSDKD